MIRIAAEIFHPGNNAKERKILYEIAKSHPHSLLDYPKYHPTTMSRGQLWSSQSWLESLPILCKLFQLANLNILDLFACLLFLSLLWELRIWTTLILAAQPRSKTKWLCVDVMDSQNMLDKSFSLSVSALEAGFWVPSPNACRSAYIVGSMAHVSAFV